MRSRGMQTHKETSPVVLGGWWGVGGLGPPGGGKGEEHLYPFGSIALAF